MRIGYFSLTLLTLASLGSVSYAQYAAVQDGDAARGARLFRQNCAGCHGDKGTGNRKGPSLVDVVGGVPTAPGFQYKSAMIFMSWVWSVERLNRFLEDPTEVQGANPASRVRKKKDREDIIAYLMTLRSPEGAPPVRERGSRY